MEGRSGFEAFFAQHWDGIVRALTLAVGDRSVAEDAAQTGFERAYARWGRVRDYERPATWVYVVAVRHAHRLLRRRPEVTAPPVDVPDPADAVESLAWLSAVIASLPPRQREAVVLRYLGGLPLADIADAQRVSVGTVKSSLHAAHRSLRVAVATDDERTEVRDAR